MAAGIERWQTVHFQLSKPDTKTRTAYNSTAGRGDGGKRNFRGQKRQIFYRTKVFSKRQQDRLSFSCIYAKNGDAALTITTKKWGWSAPKSPPIEIDRWRHEGLHLRKAGKNIPKTCFAAARLTGMQEARGLEAPGDIRSPGNMKVVTDLLLQDQHGCKRSTLQRLRYVPFSRRSAGMQGIRN